MELVFTLPPFCSAPALPAPPPSTRAALQMKSKVSPGRRFSTDSQRETRGKCRIIGDRGLSIYLPALAFLALFRSFSPRLAHELSSQLDVPAAISEREKDKRKRKRRPEDSAPLPSDHQTFPPKSSVEGKMSFAHQRRLLARENPALDCPFPIGFRPGRQNGVCVSPRGERMGRRGGDTRGFWSRRGRRHPGWGRKRKRGGEESASRSSNTNQRRNVLRIRLASQWSLREIASWDIFIDIGILFSFFSLRARRSL